MQDQPNHEEIMAVIVASKKNLRETLTQLNSLNAPVDVLRALVEAISMIDLSYHNRPTSGFCGAAMIARPQQWEMPPEMRTEIETIVRSQLSEQETSA